MEGISDESVLILFGKRLLAIFIGFFSDDVFGDGGIDEVLSAAWDPPQVDDELAVHVVSFIDLRAPVVHLGILSGDHEGSQNQVPLLLAAIALDKEPAGFDDAVKVNLLAVPLTGAVIVES